MIKTEKETFITNNPDGSQEISTRVKETQFDNGAEPDYIKLYTKMWCDFKGIPDKYCRLFIELAMRMSYCSSSHLEYSQLVNTGSLWGKDIMKACGWKTRDPYLKGLKALCECNAIRKVARGVYQINPEYAGRGAWRYNPKMDQGGIKDLIVTFNFRENKCETNIVWADDEEDNERNRMFRTMLSDSPHIDDSKPIDTQVKRFEGTVDGER